MLFVYTGLMAILLYLFLEKKKSKPNIKSYLKLFPMHLNSLTLSWKISGNDFSVWKYLNARNYSKYLFFKVQLGFELYVRSLRWIKSKIRNNISYEVLWRFHFKAIFIYCQCFFPMWNSSSRQTINLQSTNTLCKHLLPHLYHCSIFFHLKVLFSFPTYSNQPMLQTGLMSLLCIHGAFSDKWLVLSMFWTFTTH